MRINSEHASLTYQPVILLAQEIPYSQYLALLATSKVCLVTSLQEAMNLVTHDFVCCHTSPAACANRGSLVLSEFAGSATDLEEGAFLVNPWDSKGCALAIKDALDIRSEEAERRWHILYHTVCDRDATRWCQGFLSALQSIKAKRARIITGSQLYNGEFSRAWRRPLSSPLIIIVSDNHALLDDDNARNLDCLNRAADNNRNIVYLASALPKSTLETLQVSPEVGLVIEDGSLFRYPGATDWEQVQASANQQMPSAIDTVVGYFQERTPGSKVTKTDLMTMFSYPKDDIYAQQQAVSLADAIIGCYGIENIRVVQGTDTVAISPAQVSWSRTLHFSLQRSLADLRERHSQNPRAKSTMFVIGQGIVFDDIVRWTREEDAMVCEVEHIVIIGGGFPEWVDSCIGT
ncbi:hypothetical protein ASPSYDRAFT_52148 [Aspergillus sydowii CBS 593.65]|uniref:Uncharacterized protein n=1 Tax=Aspergillus sydowii CBS 593.65 TaxID=1036612 RepID=A0A1L9SYJ5_9EURO|nr:uncharacterized protein ASPSYDRAFT_52148 [Aspergillus sydowii CBS 593.65]OJJ52260.1 hypothetical protein ASPSYDRAFT_52148 [Aspergillus sydowii CBS 593.65]